MSSSRVVDFLTRAQAITKNTRVESNKPSNSQTRNSTNSPIALKKKSLSPISYQSYSSTHEETPMHTDKKFILSGTFNGKKHLTVPANENFETTMIKSPRFANSKDKNYSGKPPAVPERKKIAYKIPNAKKIEESLGEEEAKQLQRDPLIEEAEKKGKKKIEKLLEVFKGEALKMDQKLQSLQVENKNLKEILANPQLASVKRDVRDVKGVLNSLMKKEGKDFNPVLDDLALSFRKIAGVKENSKQIANWFECLEVQSDEFGGFLNTISKKIVQEQQKRLKTEEDTGKMIEYEENMIKELEMKLANAEVIARRASVHIMHENTENEFDSFDRNAAMKNLNNLLEKSAKKIDESL